MTTEAKVWRENTLIKYVQTTVKRKMKSVYREINFINLFNPAKLKNKVFNSEPKEMPPTISNV